MKYDAIFKKNFTAEHAEIAEIIKNLFLGVLCELCGERLCFLFDQTGSFFGRRLR